MMKNSLKLISAFVVSMAAISAQAQVTVKNAWVRATVPQQMATGVFFDIQSNKDARVISVQTSAAGIAEIHEMKMEKNVMKMRPIEYLELPAGKSIELKPGGYHLMLMDLKAQIKLGDAIPLTLVVEGKDKKRETIDILVKARSINGADGKM
ncbi:MAG: copper chaperone PCu(A)C [Cytophaga sp.]|nr:copper chaperone PCu(A)C [Undibacterium sp.]